MIKMSLINRFEKLIDKVYKKYQDTKPIDPNNLEGENNGIQK